MAIYSKDSLETLRQKVDLLEVIAPYVRLRRSGSSYTGLCPFHEEKTPSFHIHKGDTHYHCFGCGAHGDAITFLMQHAKMGFVEAIESLSETFQVPLDKEENVEKKGPNRARLRELLERACIWSHFFLLQAEEGEQALAYLSHRGLSLAFIQRFMIGYCPLQGDVLCRLLVSEGFTEEEIDLAGLCRLSRGGMKDFFSGRIVFPIRDRRGAVIGFSGRKFLSETQGGKYINTKETPLFKKSQVLFALSYSKQTIIKEKKALIVEGQIDALRLIDAGIDFTVAGQGTAFGEGHVQELMQLGVSKVYLALDADAAGQEAAYKMGDLFQAKGVEVLVLTMPEGQDPDSFLHAKGRDAFIELIAQARDYLSFCYRYKTRGADLSSPSVKSAIVEEIALRIRAWSLPVMVHESLKKLALLAQVPQEMLLQGSMVEMVVRKKEKIGEVVIDPDKVVEVDVLRLLLLAKEQKERVFFLAKKHLSKDDFRHLACAEVFSCLMETNYQENQDLLSLAALLPGVHAQGVVEELLQRPINPLKEEELMVEAINALWKRRWLLQREALHRQIQLAQGQEELSLALLQEYNALLKNPPLWLEKGEGRSVSIS